MKEVIIALILGPMLFIGCAGSANGQSNEQSNSGISSSQGDNPGNVHRVLVFRTPEGVGVRPGTTIARKYDSIRFVAVNGTFEVILEFADTSAIISKGKPFVWEVPPNLEPSYYEYKVTEVETKLRAVGHSAPVIIIDPE